MSNPAPTLNQINAFNATQGTTIDFNIIGGTEVIRSNKIYIYDLSDNSLICTHLYVSTESIHELPPNTSSSIVYASGKSSADFTNNTQYYAQIQTFTDVGGTQGGSGLSIAKLFWCLPTPTLTLSTIPTTISTTSYNVSATYTPNTSGGATNEIQEFQFNLYSAIGALLQTSGVVLYGEGVDLSYNFSGLEVDSTYYVTLDVTTTQGMNVSAQSNTFTVSIDTPTMGSASVVNNGCDGYISVTSNLSSEYEDEESAEVGEIMSFTTDSVNDITELDVDFEPVQDDTPWMSTQNTEPYTFRAVPSQTEDFGHESDTIVGGTVGWNQLIEHGNFDATTGWSTAGYGNMTVNNNIGTVTLTDAGTSGRIERSITPTVGHKMLCIANVKPSFSTNLYITFAGTGAGAYFARLVGATADSWNQISGIRNVVDSDLSSGVIRFYFGGVAGSVGATAQFKDIVLFDLTQMFGSTIADYIYSLEQANAGAGVAWFRKLFPNSYYAYDAGSLVSVSGLTSHDMVGFNQWDEAVEDGSINWSTGEDAYGNNVFRTKNYIRVMPSTNYYWKFPTGSTSYIRMAFYDINKQFLGATTWQTSSYILTIPANCYYARFAVVKEYYGTTYKHDICINLSNPSLNGTYKPYVKHTYPLDSTLTLRGIPKLDANNNLYYDGDIYESSGNVTRKYYSVTFDGSEDGWNWYDGYYQASINLPFVGKYEVSTVSYICDKLKAVSNNMGSSNIGNYARLISSGAGVGFSAPNCTTLEQFKTWVSNNNITFLYELATPTTSIADPYTNPQIVDPHGTEEYVGSPIPVGHKTTYQRICPISGWDSVSVDVVGVNIFDEQMLVSMCSAVKQSDGTYYISNLNSAYGKKIWNNPTGYEGQLAITFIRKQASSGIGLRWKVYYTDGTNNSIGNVDQNADIFTTYTLVTNVSKVVDYIVGDYGGNKATYCNIQIEVGSTATPYTPYNGQTYTSTFPKYKQQVTQDKTPYITKNIGDTYADTLTENLVGGTIAWNQSVPDTTTTHTVSGSIASMNDAVAGNFESVVCDIDPVQDLHGYDKPWVGGSHYNQWDEEWELGSIDANGQNEVANDRIRSKNYIKVTPNTSYYVCAPYGVWFWGYDSDQNFVQRVPDSNSINNIAFTVPSGISYLRLVCRSNYGTTYHNDIAINYPSSITTYSPYSNICPITGWTGCEVSQSPYEQTEKHTITGKNIYNAPNNTSGVLVPCHIADGVTVTASCSGSNASIYYYNANKVQIDYWNLVSVASDGRYYRSFTTSGGVEYVEFRGTQRTKYMVELNTATPSPYEPYGNHYPVSWQTEAGTVYGGTVDVVTGVLTAYPYYASYNGETLVGPWVSSMDEYIEGRTPTTGAQVVDLGGTPTTYQLTPTQIHALLGQNNVWANCGDTSVTYPTNHSYQSLSTTHKYYKRINGVESISVGSDVVADVGTDNIIDLTQMFGTTIADYIYNREQSSSGKGVQFFKSLFPNDDYDYNSGALISVNASAHVIKDANGNVLHTYPLDSDLVLRGIPKLDANNKLYYDGDVYQPNGSVTRKYGIVDLGTLTWYYYTAEGKAHRFNTDVPNCPYDLTITNFRCSKNYNMDSTPVYVNDKDYCICIFNHKLWITDANYSDTASFKTAMSGVYLVYELDTPTSESADPFEENQAIVSNGIAEYIVTEQGDVEMPVGHDSTYYATEVYGGTIDMAKGVLIVEWASITLNGSNSWVSQDTLTTTKHYSCDISGITASTGVYNDDIMGDNMPTIASNVDSIHMNHRNVAVHVWIPKDIAPSTYFATNPLQVVYPLATPITMQLTSQQMQTLSGQNNIWSNTNGDMYLVYQLPITSLLVKRRDVADVSGKWLTLYSVPITQASDMDFTFIDFLNQYGKKYQYALVPVLAQDQSGVIVQIEGGYTVSDNVDSIFDGVYIADQTNVERVKAGVGYGNIDMNQGVGSITPIGSKYPIVITNSQNQYHNGSIRGTIVPNDFYSNGNLSRIDMVNKRDELEQFLTNKRAKIIKDWNGKMWLVMIMSNVNCSFDDNYGMGMVSFSADWLEVGDPTNQQDLYNAGLINVGGV